MPHDRGPGPIEDRVDRRGISVKPDQAEMLVDPVDCAPQLSLTQPLTRTLPEGQCEVLLGELGNMLVRGVFEAAYSTVPAVTLRQVDRERVYEFAFPGARNPCDATVLPA